MKIGILGGTFDPPHLTHLDLALTAARKLSFDQVILVPNKRNVLKRRGPKASAKDRFQMAKLMAEGHDNLAVSDIELARVGPSYAFETMIDLRQAMRGDFWWIMGSDAAKYLEEWRELDKLLRQGRLAVGLRPPDTLGDVMRYTPEKAHNNLDFFELDHPSTRSSTEIRNNVALNLDESSQVLPQVWEYIKSKNLYKYDDLK